MKRVVTPSYPVQIFVAGNIYQAEMHCRAYCDQVGLCVTVTRTIYVYSGGEEDGVVVGLINYGRFPSTPDAIFAHAEALALRLIDGLGQESASIQSPDRTVWISFRETDAARIEARSDETAKRAQPEGREPDTAAQKPV